MWPNKKAGTHLTYGVDGSLVVKPSSKPGLFKTPRIKVVPQTQLQAVDNSFLRLTERQLAKRLQLHTFGDIDRTVDVSNGNKDLQDTFFVPNAILEEGHQESTSAQFKRIHDPSFGDLLSTFKYRSYTFSQNVLISVAGEFGDIVSVVILADNTNSEKMYAPQLSSTKAIKFSSKVKQILIPEKLNQTDRDSHVFGVRTDNSVHFFRIRIDSRFSVAVSKLIEISKHEIAGQSLADASFCPHNNSYVGIVDVKGKFSVFRLVRRDADKYVNDYRKLDLEYDTFHDPAELSNFKRIFWGTHQESFYLMSRSSIHRYDYNLSSLKCKVIANAWTKLLDVVRTVGNYCFLLTTREISIIDLGTGFSIDLAWAHLLDESDLTMKLKVIPVSQDGTNPDSFSYRFVCLIYSQVRVFTYVVEFGIRDGSPVLINHPYYFIPHPNKTIQTCTMIQLNAAEYAYYQVTSDIEISSMLMHFQEHNEFRVPADNRRGESSVAKAQLSGDLKKKKKLYEFLIKLQSDEANSLDSSQSISREETLIQQHADKLGIAVSQFLQDPKSLFCSMVENGFLPCYLENVEEFQSMIEQLMTHYSQLDSELKFSHSHGRMFSDQAKANEEIEDYNHLDVFESLLRSFRKMEAFKSTSVKLSNSITLNLGLSTLTMAKKDKVANEDFGLDDISSQLPPELRSLLDQWPDDRATASFTQESTLSQQWDVPSVAESQSRRSSKKSVKKRPLKLSQLSQLSQPSSSLSSSQYSTQQAAESQPVLVTAQAQSQSIVPETPRAMSQIVTGSSSAVKKRKKKKLGGFM